MKSTISKAVVILLFLAACAKVPITQRSQMNLVPESQMIAMSLTSYNDFLKTNHPVTSGPDADMVKRVGAKIQAAVTQYMNQNGYASRIEGYKWEFNLVNSKE